MLKLRVPLKDDPTTAVEVGAAELPADPAAVLHLLRRERASAATWLAFALAYARLYGPSRPSLLADVAAAAIEALDADANGSSSHANALRALRAAALVACVSQARAGSAERSALNRSAIAALNASGGGGGSAAAAFVSRGFLLLLEGGALSGAQQLERAAEEFAFVLASLDARCAAAVAGEALVHLLAARPAAALARFRDALRIAPRSPGVRFGIAAAAARLPAHDALARTALGAAQAAAAAAGVAPVALEAGVAGAVLELSRDAARPAVERLLRAMEAARARHPVALAHVAGHAFFRGDAQRALELAAAAAAAAAGGGDDAQVAHAEFLVGRAHHAMGNVDEAHRHYLVAAMSWDALPLAQYGLGQTFIARGELDKAADAFERVLKAVPESVDALSMLAAVTARLPGRAHEALELAARAAELRPADPQPWLDMARLANVSEPAGAAAALAHYQKAVETLTDSGHSVPQEVWNNIGALQLSAGELGHAEESFRRAIEAGGAPLEEYAERNITPTFNLARVFEARRDDLRAEELYKGILQEHPTYIDCYLRLGMMARTRGAFGDAAEWVKEVFTLEKDHTAAWALMASLHFDLEDWQNAQKRLEALLKADPADSYALVALGNLYYNARLNSKDKAERLLRISCDMYLKAVRKDPANVFAGNGLGIILAERGDVSAAREAFVQVRDASIEVPDVQVNLGHIFMLQGQFASAARMYNNALRNSSEDNTQVLLFRANALFEQHSFDECQRTLQIAVRGAPQILVLWYNLALCCQESCSAALRAAKPSESHQQQQIFQRPQERVAAMKKALADAQTAASIFAWLGTAKPISQSIGGVLYKHNMDRAGKHGDRCRKLVERAKAACAEAEELERLEAERRREELIKLEEACEARRKAEAAEAEAKRAEEEKLQMLVKEQQEREQAVSAALIEETRKAAETESHRRHKSSAANTDAIEEAAVAGMPEEGAPLPMEEEEEDGTAVASSAQEEQPTADEDKKRAIARAIEKIRSSKRAREAAEAAAAGGGGGEENEDEEEEGHKRKKKKKHHHHHKKHRHHDDDEDDEEAPPKEHKRSRLRKVAPDTTPSPEKSPAPAADVPQPPTPPAPTEEPESQPQQPTLEVPAEQQ